MKTIQKMALATVLLPALTVAAQQHANDSTLNRTVVVENQYNPEVMDAFKINVLPEIEEPAVAKQHINYAQTQRALSSWTVVPMEPIIRSQEQPKAPRGYVRAAYGNRNNADLLASYLWSISKKDLLGFRASLYGFSGDTPMLAEDADWSSRFFRTDVSLDYKHDFRAVALKLGGNFASQVFNYMPASVDALSSADYFNHQHFTAGEGYLGVESKDENLPVQFGLQAGLRTFKRKYPQSGYAEGSEKIVHAVGYMSGEISDGQTIGVRLTLDNVSHDAEGLEDYTLVQANPYYAYTAEQFQVRLGAHVDAQFSFDSGLKVAPDVELNYVFADACRLYAKAGGGTRLNDFRQLNTISPYWLQSEQQKTTYAPIDLSVGLKASPLTGLGFHLYGGYRIVKNEICVLPGAVENHETVVYAVLKQDKAKVGYGGASIDYTYRDRIDFSLSGTYYNWSLDGEENSLLALKPQFVLDASVRARIFDGLHVGLSYNYEGRQEIEGLEKADAVNNLQVKADYELLERIHVFASVNNLLNKKYLTGNGYPMQGLYFMAGLSCRF